MAITLEEIQKVIAGDNEITESVINTSQSLYDMFDRDVQGLKHTNLMLKEEKTDVQNKWRADQEKFAESERNFQEQLKSANEQIANGNPEQTKYFETQREMLEQGYKSQIAERDQKITDLNATIEDFKKKDIFNSMKSEFRKEASKCGIAPDSMDMLEYYILGANGSNFAPRDTSEGRMFWANDNSGDDIASRVNKFLKTPSGKRFLPFNSTGAGAEGSTGMSSNGGKTMSNQEFLKLSSADRRRVMAEGYKITN